MSCNLNTKRQCHIWNKHQHSAETVLSTIETDLFFLKVHTSNAGKRPCEKFNFFAMYQFYQFMKVIFKRLLASVAFSQFEN